VRVEDGTAPMNHYGLTKVYAEQMGLMYVLQHGMSVLMVRPGWVPREPPKKEEKPGGNPRIYLSHDDAGRFFTAAVEAPRPGRPGFGIAFALSRCEGDPMYDLTSAKELIGFEPGDIWPEGLHW
jgi:nucleoside-diphosphate-sugar epimerase